MNGALYIFTIAVADGTGASRMGQLFAKALERHGHRVRFVLGGVRDRRGELSSQQQSFRSELMTSGFDVLEMSSIASPLWGSEARFFRHLISERVRAVVSFHPRDQVVALRACDKACVPCVISAQTIIQFWGSRAARRLKNWVYRTALSRHPAIVLCPSEAVRAQLVGHYGVQSDKAILLPNAIDPALFLASSDARDQVRREFGVEADELLLVNIGRLDQQKGQDILIEAFALLRRDLRAKLVMVGDVSASAHESEARRFERRLHALVRHHCLVDRVLFAGWRSDISSVLQACDIYVHPARWEGFPLAVLEAMAAAKPVVASDCAGSPIGWVNGRDGIIVPAGHVEALRAALEAMTEFDGEQRKSIGLAARRIVEQSYDITAVGDRFVKLIEEYSDQCSSQSD